MRPKPITMFFAKSGAISKNSWSSTTIFSSFFMSYGTFASAGTMLFSAGSARSRGSLHTRVGTPSLLFSGR